MDESVAQAVCCLHIHFLHCENLVGSRLLGIKAGVPRQSAITCGLIGLTAGVMYAYQNSAGESSHTLAQEQERLRSLT